MDNKWTHALTSAGFSFLAVYCGLGCMATGLFLDVDLLVLGLCCALLALVLCCFLNTRYWLVPLCVGALAVGYFWAEDTLRLSVERLIYHVSGLYDKGYGWGTLQWSEWDQLGGSLLPAMLLLAGVETMLVGAALVRRRFAWAACGLALMPLLTCAVLTDTVPDELYLGGLMLAVLLILMTDHARKKGDSNRLSAMLAVPMALAVLALFVFCPRDTYNGQAGAQKLEDFVLWVLNQDQVPDVLDGPNLIPGDQEKVVQLADVGNRKESRNTVMTVKAQENATLYLRGCAYDDYDGKAWRSTPGWNAWSVYYGASDSEPHTLTIRTRQAHSVLYFTYSPYNAPQKILGGRMRNADDLRTYTIHYQHPVTYEEYWDAKNDDVGGAVLEEYLQLPEESRQRAQLILQKKIGVPMETNNAGQIWKNAIYISQWVQGRNRYDLDTDPMPAGEEDFALWFLEKAESGYCTHYASALVVLLRAAGIPAQYVTGYLVTTRADQEVTVTEANAHAWVEVFIKGIGWVVLDPTPSGEQEQTQTPDPSQPVFTTEPDETTPTEPETTGPEETKPTEPKPTEPTETRPAQTTGPGATEPGSQTVLPGGNPRLEAAISPVLWVILGILLAVIAVIGQWRLRLWQQRKKLRTGDPNSRLLARWALLEKLCRAHGTQPPEQLYWLAQKARFSQYTADVAELRQLDAGIKAQRDRLKARALPLQLWYRLVLALY